MSKKDVQYELSRRKIYGIQVVMAKEHLINLNHDENLINLSYPSCDGEGDFINP